VYGSTITLYNTGRVEIYIKTMDWENTRKQTGRTTGKWHLNNNGQIEIITDKRGNTFIAGLLVYAGQFEGITVFNSKWDRVD
jgi:hypothetical protein